MDCLVIPLTVGDVRYLYHSYSQGNLSLVSAQQGVVVTCANDNCFSMAGS